jgi:hypothetical protein
MESQQMMELLLAMREEMNANQEKTHAKLEKAEVDRRTDKEQMLAEILGKADADRKAYREDLKEIKSGQAEMRSIVNAWLTDMRISRKETMACQEMTQARLECKEPASVDMTPEVAHEQ